MGQAGSDERRRWEWLEITLVCLLAAACVFATIWFHYVSDVSYVFPNIYYLPIILACLWWDRRGIALAVFLAVFLVLSSAFSPGEQPLWDDMVRAGVFILVGTVIGELSARRRELVETLEERVRGRTKELQARNEELDTFTRAVSHDLIGPLSTLHGYVKVAQGAADGPLRVEIGGFREGDTVTLFVRDDGVGIEGEPQEEIFEDFRRESGKDNKPGLGLGLSIVRRAVEGWGGAYGWSPHPARGPPSSSPSPRAEGPCRGVDHESTAQASYRPRNPGNSHLPPSAHNAPGRDAAGDGGGIAAEPGRPRAAAPPPAARWARRRNSTCPSPIT